jgi:symplekin
MGDEEEPSTTAQPVMSDDGVLSKLDTLRELALTDPAHWEAIVSKVTEFMGNDQSVEVLRWGIQFLAEAFATPTLKMETKQKMSLQILDTLKNLLEMEAEDPMVISSVVQVAASIYPLVFRHV